MKITFISNSLTPHQIPFCNSMYKILGENFKFVSCSPLSNERIILGWDNNVTAEYEIRLHEESNKLNIVEELLLESDVVIIGSASEKFIKNRLKNKKITFKYSERLYKKGLSAKNYLKAMISAYIHHGQFQKYPLYMLCASAYTPYDLSIFNNYIDKTFKWGYFPEFKVYDIEYLIEQKNSACLSILWVGRFEKIKHPELAIEVAKYLKKKGIKFNLTMIGEGREFEKIKKMVNKFDLTVDINFTGIKNAEEVRLQMEKSDIFLLTSDFNEGWGAVLNEAMNSGCVVIASHAAGSVPFLIENFKNGIIYENGNTLDLCEKVLAVTENPDLRKKISRKAYLTIKDFWNSDIAAQRIIFISEKLIDKSDFYYNKGPGSKAGIIKNNWFKE